MKLIHKFKSPNFNERKSNNINLIIIHYTALKTITDSINYLCDKRNKVSSHYLISKKGEIFNLVSEKKRAWHAGKSHWSADRDLNSSSIGIELDYAPSTTDNKYNLKLINSLIILLKNIMSRYEITAHNILGHSDIAPYRKIDPGIMFPWNLLEKKKVAFKIIKLKNINIIKNLIKQWFLKHNLKSERKNILFMLSYIGYDVSLASKNKKYFNQLILIYSNRFIFFKNKDYNKKNIYKVIEYHFINILLTKAKK